MTIALKGFNHAGFACDDIERTRVLCEQVLGLEPIPSLRTGFDGYKLAWFKDAAGNEYHVSERIPDFPQIINSDSDFNPSLHQHVAFEVEDFEQAKAELERHGFDFYEMKGEGITTRRQLYVQLEDSGQMLELFENVP
jgi:catechol 2,3-dioxygenase-like lactoylglutathione lyase family enzyme